MSFRGLGGRFIAYIACGFYLTQSYFNCIVVLFFLFLTIMTLCGLLQLHYFWSLWSEYMPDLLVTWVIRLFWQNAATFTRLFISIQNFTSSCTYLPWGYVKFSEGMLVQTVINCLFLEWGPHIDKKVCFIKGR